MARDLVVLFSLLSVGVFSHSSSEEVTKCIDGPHHKDKPSPEGPDYVECHSWKEKSCCTAEFTAELQSNKVEVLYNFSWNHCKNLSQVRFTIRETFLVAYGGSEMAPGADATKQHDYPHVSCNEVLDIRVDHVYVRKNNSSMTS